MTAADRAKLCALLRERLPEGCRLSIREQRGKLYATARYPAAAAPSVRALVDETFPDARTTSGSYAASDCETTWRIDPFGGDVVGAALREFANAEASHGA